MLRFTTIKKTVSALHEQFDAERYVKLYTIERQLRPAPFWQVAGMYVQLSSDARLVFEALHHSKLNDAFVRVYRDSPLEVIYARKARRREEFVRAVKSAAAAFRALLPTTRIDDLDLANRIGEIPVTAYEMALLAEVLKPLPPPITQNEIKRA